MLAECCRKYLRVVYTHLVNKVKTMQVMEITKAAQDVFKSETCHDLASLLNCLNSQLLFNLYSESSLTSDLIDIEFFNEINEVKLLRVPIYFGRTLRDLKCVVMDSNGIREHEIFLQYKSPKKLALTNLNLPYSAVQDKFYETIHEIITTVKEHVNSLEHYFNELEHIDRFCTVMEPVKPTFKEDYRRIMLGDRIWLHVEVTPDGLATNVHLIGQSEEWQDRLQAGLLKWDHDQNIVENIMTMFDIVDFPVPDARSSSFDIMIENSSTTQVPQCSICLCSELSGAGLPQPLCSNSICGVYFHRGCLYQWLVACAGGRVPSFGVATGSCPTCFHQIACSEKDN